MEDKVKIAYLILCHTDPNHILRLANKLTYKNDNMVFIHIDKKVKDNEFYKLLRGKERIKIINDNVDVYWGGYSSVKATINLLKESVNEDIFDRYVLLQGLDYPIASNREIEEFFSKNKEVEFIRACNVSISKEKYFYKRSRYYWQYDKINLIKKICNRLNDLLDLKIRKGYIVINKKRHDIYWGCAQWALTHDCVKYILEFEKENYKFNNYFKHVFPPDETYFHTIIFNSNFKNKTVNNGEEKEKRYLVNWRNLHYFEYDKYIRIYNHNDLELINSRKELFIRKVTTEESSKLLDIIDELHRSRDKNAM